MTLPEKAAVAKFHPWDRCWNVDCGPRKAIVFPGIIKSPTEAMEKAMLWRMEIMRPGTEDSE